MLYVVFLIIRTSNPSAVTCFPICMIIHLIKSLREAHLVFSWVIAPFTRVFGVMILRIHAFISHAMHSLTKLIFHSHCRELLPYARSSTYLLFFRILVAKFRPHLHHLHNRHASLVFLILIPLHLLRFRHMLLLLILHLRHLLQTPISLPHLLFPCRHILWFLIPKRVYSSLGTPSTSPLLLFYLH